MQQIILVSVLFFLAAVFQVVHADVDYFKQPAMENQEFMPGSSADFVVAQLPDIDGQAINANVYPEGKQPQELVMTIQSWSPSSVSDSAKNDFAFTWQIPSNIKPGRYFVKIDINNDQDDNDICRSKTFTILPSQNNGGGAASSRFVSNGRPPAGGMMMNNPGMKMPSYAQQMNDGAPRQQQQRYAGNTKLSALHLRRRAI
ncbi:hypothetical protein BCR42DRAFT_420499 [Absidia repens]|uniref:Ser-Thr-rich glycosyl-phosphatidyl-inositol-anchored membrane family-domain-containing protein n=1 Tax=Absidia repens TaxID=90262 RepID=A0A1X2I9T5_9FUNG|nr:hypothetical protein BCR42DRAFT_420499 [Absidia repens]